MLSGVSMHPHQATCLRYGCTEGEGRSVSYGGGCCTVITGTGMPPNYMVSWQEIANAYRWVC